MRSRFTIEKKNREKGNGVCLTRLEEGLDMCGSVLCSVPFFCRAFKGVVFTGKMWERFNGVSGYPVSPVDIGWDCMPEHRFILPSCMSCTGLPSEEPLP